MKKLYYIQDLRQCVGNCVLWWGNPGGYTCNLDKAELFTKEEADRIHKNRDSDIPWLKSDVDECSCRHIDIQLLRKSK